MLRTFPGRTDINLSDKNFFRDLTIATLERTQRALDSNVWLTNRWDWGRAYLFGQYTEDLDPSQNNDADSAAPSGGRFQRGQKAAAGPAASILA